MRALLLAAASAAALYAGYWFVGSRLVLDATETALDEIRAAGAGDYAHVGLRGFPSRFDITVDEPRLQSADGSVAWAAPFFQTFALSYRPNRIIAVWPDSQTFRLRNEEIALRTSDMRASAAFGFSTAVPLDHMALIATDGDLTSTAGWSATFAKLRFATERAEGQHAHRIGLAVSDLKPQVDGLPAAFTGPGVTASLLLDGIVAFDRPIDRHAGRDGLAVRTLSATALDLAWGPVSISGKGDLAVSPDGYPAGRIDLEITGWRELPALLVATGAIAPAVARPLEGMMQGIARSSGDPEVLALPLIFRAGRISLGPVPVGRAPRLAP